MFGLRNGNSNDGMAAAEHLVGALLFASGKWYMNDPTVEVMFKDPSKGMLSKYKSYEVVNRGGWLLVRKSTMLRPNWATSALLKTKSPAEAVRFMQKDSGGHIVKVGVECKDDNGGTLGTLASLAVNGSTGSGGTCRDATFWDIKFESRKANKASNGSKKNAVATAAAKAVRA